MKKLKKIDGFCVPLTLKYVSGLSDKKILDVCEKNGFKQKWGMEESEVTKSASELNIRYRRINLKRDGLYNETLEKFIKNNPSGVFMIGTLGHLFAVHDGEVIDPINANYPGLKRLVVWAWKVF